MSEKTVKCSKCKKSFDNYINSYEVKFFIEPHGMCRECLFLSKGLVKVENHYVPWNYKYDYEDDKPTKEEYHKDVNASLPKIEWCDIFNKYKITFSGVDYGGYDGTWFTWYYDTISEFLEDMGLTLDMCRA